MIFQTPKPHANFKIVGVSYKSNDKMISHHIYIHEI